MIRALAYLLVLLFAINLLAESDNEIIEFNPFMAAINSEAVILIYNPDGTVKKEVRPILLRGSKFGTQQEIEHFINTAKINKKMIKLNPGAHSRSDYIQESAVLPAPVCGTPDNSLKSSQRESGLK